ncbi:hypothetical protein ZWY2020_016830 [Hordeum vulgare]|nr:hypothetical protein ZWY2020_016830 [Hordeum vulgare]
MAAAAAVSELVLSLTVVPGLRVAVEAQPLGLGVERLLDLLDAADAGVHARASLEREDGAGGGAVVGAVEADAERGGGGGQGRASRRRCARRRRRRV